MKKSEIAIFIEELENIGDKWTPVQVEDVYGESILEDAIHDRKSHLDSFLITLQK